MEKYLPVIKTCRLFAGIATPDLKKLLHCLGAARAGFEKNCFIFHTGDAAGLTGIVLSGRVQVLQEDYWGNRSILTQLEPGGTFGEAVTCAEIQTLQPSVLAVEKSDILLLDCNRIMACCSTPCAFHTDMIKNMVRILAGKNIYLTQKIWHITRRTTREKLLSYLSAWAARAGDSAFEIPFNRQELANYLSVDRSALSNELSKMRDENILRCRRNYFELLRERVRK
ncbi:MAG: Crp/Fnr family transcriptional regulator [Desulfovibrio sp.]|jgi:CRP-like cAMP-binding protein|nr:Crp/Fnr family transcriptional regulator [Desulfovibrio sp.]